MELREKCLALGWKTYSIETVHQKVNITTLQCKIHIQVENPAYKIPIK